MIGRKNGDEIYLLEAVNLCRSSIAIIFSFRGADCADTLYIEPTTQIFSSTVMESVLSSAVLLS